MDLPEDLGVGGGATAEQASRGIGTTSLGEGGEDPGTGKELQEAGQELGKPQPGGPEEVSRPSQLESITTEGLTILPIELASGAALDVTTTPTGAEDVVDSLASALSDEQQQQQLMEEQTSMTTTAPQLTGMTYPSYTGDQPVEMQAATRTMASPPLGGATEATARIPTTTGEEGTDATGTGRSARCLPTEIATHPAILSLAGANSEIQHMMEYEHVPTDVNPQAQQTAASYAAGESIPEMAAATTTPGVGGGTAAAGGAAAGEGGKYVDITDYLNMPQTRVAKQLGIPSSTLSKRWREAARQRKWPWRTVCKIDKEIMALLHNIGSNVNLKGGPEAIPGELQGRLVSLLRQRQEELKPVVIRL